MNKIIIIMLLLSSTLVVAQDALPQETAPQDTIWRVDGAFGLLFNQVALTNWSAGGENSLAWSTTFDLNANYSKGSWKWDNLVHLGYGLSKQGEDPFNKTDDQILLNTSVGYELSGPWYANFSANFRTQFTEGFNSPDDSVRSSTFMAPGYLVTGLGIEYKPNDDFVFIVAPLSNKTVFVLDDELSKQGAYGVDSLAKTKREFGAFISFFYKKEVVKNVTLSTLYTMFGDYNNLSSWDINWDLIIDFKINSFLEANLTTNLIYDEDIAIPVDRTGDGVKEGFGPRVQFRQALGIGLTAKF